ncbi:MAG: adenine phosphoribosyltransferase [Dehalococcoidia bacterium]|nr:adenine phosphoribosyltransferase [Dehalococcoidia bacterium]
MTTDLDRLPLLIREIPDFPAPGVLFRDITPLLYDPPARRAVLDALAEAARDMGATLICGVESRGFIFGVPVAERLDVPFVPVRKPGKLPHDIVSVTYALEYGEGELEMHRHPPVQGHRVVIVDDLLATGGTASAAARLVEECGGQVAGYAFVVELAALEGRAALGERPAVALVTY